MSWLPRVPSLGRFSPFNGTPKQQPSSPAPRVTEDDFSYITTEDLQNNTQAPSSSSDHDHRHHHSHHHHPSQSYAHSYDHLDPRHSEPSILHKTPSYPQPATASTPHLAAPSHLGDGTRPRSRSRAHSRSRDVSQNREKLDRPPRDTDVLHLRCKGQTMPVHFAAYSIDDGNVTVGSARDHAARRLDVHDPKRIRMFWRGRNLKEDRETLRDVGVRSGEKTEIMVVVGHSDRDDESESSSGEEDSEAIDGTGENTVGGGRRTKKRSGRKKGGKKKSSSGSSTPAYSTAGAGAEHLPIPSGLHPLHKTSSAPGNGVAASAGASSRSSRQPSPQPTTPAGKLQALQDKFQELLPMAQNFTKDPPREKEKRDFEHKKVTETIMTQVLLKVDGVETEGDEDARTMRKALVKEVQGWLNKVDEVVKR